MKTTNASYLKLILTFILLVIFWFLASLWSNNVVLLWLILLAVLAIVVLGRNFRRLSKRDWVIGSILGLLVVFTNPIFAALTLLTYLASCPLLKDRQVAVNLLWPSSSKKFSMDIVFGFLLGLVLGALNIWLAKVKLVLPSAFNIQALLNAVRAGVFEETAFRLFFFALLVNLCKKENFSKLENVLVYLILTVPHTLVHFSIQEFEISNVIVLSLVFGLPFAFLLQKRGLVSAMTAHAMVDLIRFVLVGF